MGSQEKSSFEIEDIGFSVLVVVISLAAVYLLAPYFGPVLWGVVAAIMFQPMTARLTERLDGRKNLAASIVLFGLIALLVVPTILLGISLVTNLAAGISDAPLNHEEVLEAGRSAASRMGELLGQIVPRI